MTWEWDPTGHSSATLLQFKAGEPTNNHNLEWWGTKNEFNNVRSQTRALQDIIKVKYSIFYSLETWSHLQYTFNNSYSSLPINSWLGCNYQVGCKHDLAKCLWSLTSEWKWDWYMWPTTLHYEIAEELKNNENFFVSTDLIPIRWVHPKAQLTLKQHFSNQLCNYLDGSILETNFEPY